MLLIKQIIMVITAIFFVVGAADYFFNSRLGLGTEFKRGFMMCGSIVLAEVGNICIAPFIATACLPLTSKISSLINADPSIFLGLLFSPDCGYQPAMTVTENAQVGAWVGCVVCAMIGGIITFSIPCALSIIKKEDHRYFSIGFMSGLIATPFACTLGGIIAGLPIAAILYNMIIPFVITVALVVLLWKAPNIAIKGFVIFGRLITLMILVGLTLAAFETLTGITLVKGLNPLSQGFAVIGTIIVSIAGIMVLTEVLRRILKKPIHKTSELMHIDDFALLSMLQALCTIMPGLGAFHKMTNRSKIVFAAFVASTANVLGAHLGFIGVYAPDLLVPMIAAKVFSGVIAIPLAILFCRRILTKQEAEYAAPCEE